MNVRYSDALVFFGATGDLAHKKIGATEYSSIGSKTSP